jgi:hypothetical protein
MGPRFSPNHDRNTNGWRGVRIFANDTDVDRGEVSITLAGPFIDPRGSRT